LALSAFAIGITEFIAVGVMPMLVTTFGISLSTAGLTVSLYAAGITVGAPLLTAVTTNLKRKQLLLSVMVTFIAGNALTAIAPNFAILLMGRVIAAFAHGLFMSTATVIAASVVSPMKRASAIATMFTGLTVATVTGVPIGTFIAQHATWRIAFLFIAVLGVLTLIANWQLVPATLPQPAASARGGFWRLLKEPRLLASLALTALGYGASFPVYTYISALLTKLGFDASIHVWLLLGYGIAVAIGNTLGGRWANHRPLTALSWMFAADLIVMLLMPLSLGHAASGILLIFLMGLFAFMNVPGLQLLTMQIAEDKHPEDAQLASALNISAFNVGIVLGSTLGGIILNHWGLTMTALGGALFAALALLISRLLARRA
jgi:predicted MFS family arabinose efflux permease